MQNVYFISGVGASKKLFDFLDLSFCNPFFVDWIPPLKKESLQHYALRLRETIPEQCPVIVGVSFGGMLASEMARAEPGIKAILISSNKSSNEFPSYLRLGNYFPVYKWIPDSIMKILKRDRFLLPFIFGTKGGQVKKMREIVLKETNIPFTKWAVGAILKWKSTKPTGNIIHIHGTADILLPNKKIKADYVIKGGTHIMVMDKAEEISAILKKLILT